MKEISPSSPNLLIYRRHFLVSPMHPEAPSVVDMGEYKITQIAYNTMFGEEIHIQFSDVVPAQGIIMKMVGKELDREEIEAQKKYKRGLNAVQERVGSGGRVRKDGINQRREGSKTSPQIIG